MFFGGFEFGQISRQGRVCRDERSMIPHMHTKACFFCYYQHMPMKFIHTALVVTAPVPRPSPLRVRRACCFCRLDLRWGGGGGRGSIFFDGVEFLGGGGLGWWAIRPYTQRQTAKAKSLSSRPHGHLRYPLFLGQTKACCYTNTHAYISFTPPLSSRLLCLAAIAAASAPRMLFLPARPALGEGALNRFKATILSRWINSVCAAEGEGAPSFLPRPPSKLPNS
jgi:hypothetical protein